MPSSRHLAAVLLVVAGTMPPAFAQTATFVPFDRFFAEVSTTPLSAQAGKPQSRMVQPAAFEAMRRHILGLYTGVTVTHSYMLAAHPYDCVPLMQQPSVRQLRLKTLATPPAMPAASRSPQPATEAVPPQVDPAQTTDGYGNAMGCESGTIPMRRVTLEDIGRFETLDAFFRKSPGPASAPQRPDPTVPAQAAEPHKYAYGYQYVTNVGGTTDINVWSPKVDTSQGEVFSLAQFWYINTTAPDQTVEAGVQVFPDMYGSDQGSLFIYWTADNYHRIGCYNLTCPGFVQTSSTYQLGGPFPRYSTLLGQQYYARLSALNQGGNWWVYLGGTDPSHAIGYYPAAVFNGRPITTAANLIEYGGEVVGTTVWPPMGSGSFAQARFRHAASQKQISYYPDPSRSVQANLYADQPSINCFTDVTSDNSGYNGWNSFFYFGGPGGAGC